MIPARPPAWFLSIAVLSVLSESHDTGRLKSKGGLETFPSSPKSFR